MALHKCKNCTSKKLGVVAAKDAAGVKVYLVICWNCGEIGQWKERPMDAMDSWNRAGGGWEGKHVHGKE